MVMCFIRDLSEWYSERSVNIHDWQPHMKIPVKNLQMISIVVLMENTETAEVQMLRTKDIFSS